MQFAAWKWTLSPWLKRAYSWLLGMKSMGSWDVMDVMGGSALEVPTHMQGIIGMDWIMVVTNANFC